jgi:hypothetical protein
MKGSPSQAGGGERRRAQRFPIKLPLQFRVWDDTVWYSGMTENISTAGIFFRCQHMVEFKQRIEIGFVLGSLLEEGGAARVACSGEVVRTEPPQEPEDPPGVAVSVSFSQLLPLKKEEKKKHGPRGPQSEN